MRYYYFAYMAVSPQGFGYYGNFTLPQKVGPVDNGFNFPEAHDYIARQHGSTGIILFWQEITEERFFQWKASVEKRNAPQKVQGTVLKLVTPQPEVPTQ